MWATKFHTHIRQKANFSKRSQKKEEKPFYVDGKRNVWTQNLYF
jgi:hypothetical protein